MKKQIKKGSLKRWNDDRGFGFIASEEGGKDIFIHISAFKRSGYRPKVGDVIFYQIHSDNNGKTRAVNAKVEGMSENKPQPRQTQQKTKQKKYRASNNNALSQWAAGIFIISIMVVGYTSFILQTEHELPPSHESYEPSSPVVLPKMVEPQNNIELESNYTCEGKVYCSEMNSCEEAKFYLKNCPDVKIDGNGDGTPCERQWCNIDFL